MAVGTDVQCACGLHGLFDAVEAHVGDHLAEGPVSLGGGLGLEEGAGGGGGGRGGVAGEGGPGGEGGGGGGGGRGGLGGGKGELEEGGVAGGDDGEVKRHGAGNTTRQFDNYTIHNPQSTIHNP